MRKTATLVSLVIAGVILLVSGSQAKSFKVKHLFTLEYGENEYLKFKEPQAVFFDKYHKEIYIADTGNNRIVTFDQNGFFLFKFGGKGRLALPTDVVVDREGRIYVVDVKKKKIAVFNFRGDFLYYIKITGLSDANSDALAIDREDHLYIVDREKGRILICNLDGKILHYFGEKGERDTLSDGEFVGPADIHVDHEGRIYVVDPLPGRVSVFSQEGDFLYRFGTKGGSTGELSFPVGVATDSKGRVLVVDSNRHTVLVYSREGEFLFEFGGLGVGEGWFFSPSSIAVDSQDRIFITDRGNNRIQVLLLEEED